MRTFHHWTPRYIVSRAVEKAYRRHNPGLPWLTQAANEILETYLMPTDSGLEFGSGRSTLWFARRTAQLTSVEHNPEWYERVRAWLEAEFAANVDYQLHPARKAPEQDAALPAYVLAAEEIAESSLDFVLVDGIYRDLCALTSLAKLKPGGVLILDNANLYLPCRSHAPNSLRLEEGPASAAWAELLDRISGWRRIWTSNGVSDTAFFFRPV